MKRDLDYIRELLFELEAAPSSSLFIYPALDSSLEEQNQLYHAKLLCDASYFIDEKSHLTDQYQFRMTNQGHDYLDSIRNDKIWSKIIKEIKPLGSVSLDIIKALGIKYISKELGL